MNIQRNRCTFQFELGNVESSAPVTLTQHQISGPNFGLLLGQRRRRWANSKPALGQRHMFAGGDVDHAAHAIRPTIVSMVYTTMLQRCKKYCRSGNIREVLIFANFASRTNSRIQEFRENYFYNSTNKEKWKFANSKHAKIIRSILTRCWFSCGPPSQTLAHD